MMRSTLILRSVSLGSLACALFALTLGLGACVGGPEKKDDKNLKKGEQVSAIPVYRTLIEQVDEKNLILADKKAARDFLKKKLDGLLAARLLKLGFDESEAVGLTKMAKPEGWIVRPHQEKIHGQGQDAGLIKDVVLWDVRGSLSLGLAEADVRGLLDRLAGLAVGSMEEIETLERFLAQVPAIKPDEQRLAQIRQKVGDAWIKVLTPFMAAQLDLPPEPIEDFVQALSQVAVVLNSFIARHPEHTGFKDLEKSFTLGALKALQTIPVKAAGFSRLNAMLARIGQMSAQSMPGVIPYLKRNLELAWRDYLIKLDDAGAPFMSARREFVYFMELFPKSKFYPDLELRFLSHWYEHLLATRPAGLDDLVGFIRETQLLAERFPSFVQVGEVREALGKQCLAVLARVEAPDLKTMTRIRSAVVGCDPQMPSGKATMDMRERLDRIEQALVDARDDKVEKVALADLTFFIEWDQLLQQLPWSRSSKTWADGKKFRQKWDGGQDAGANCRCTLDPDAPCREFAGAGPAGGFELVARFYQEKLAGVDLCQVYTGSKLNPIYRFFSRRYKKSHGSEEAAAFLAGAGGVGDSRKVSFVKPGLLEVTLERSADTCTIRYRSLKMLKVKHKEEEAELAREKREKRKTRAARINKGWSAGDCVRWQCKPSCKYTGRLKTKKKKRYLVTISDNPENSREAGKDVWVKQEELYDCSN